MIIVCEDQLIDLYEKKSDVLCSNASECQKISLDIQRIKKPEKIFGAYNIPEGSI